MSSGIFAKHEWRYFSRRGGRFCIGKYFVGPDNNLRAVLYTEQSFIVPPTRKWEREKIEHFEYLWDCEDLVN